MKISSFSLAFRFRFAFVIIGVAFVVIGVISAISAERMMTSGKALYIGLVRRYPEDRRSRSAFRAGAHLCCGDAGGNRLTKACGKPRATAD